jgi:hypothetical protein
MRRIAALAPILALAAALLARRRRRARPAPAPLGASPAAEALPAPTASPASAASPPRFASVPWELVAAPVDRPRLTLRYAADARLELDRVDAQETPTQVFVTVLLRRRERAGAPAPAAAPREREATVPLSAPLGARELIHAPTDVDPPPAAGGDPDGPPLYP